MEITGYGKNIKGNLFYYRLELTNNEGFMRRYIIPIFVDQNGTFNQEATEWFESNYKFSFGIDVFDDLMVDVEVLEKMAESVLEEKIKDYMTETKLELLEKIDTEHEKADKYFNDNKTAVSKIGIENIREGRLREIEEQQTKERTELQKKKNLVPKTTLFAAAEVTLRD